MVEATISRPLRLVGKSYWHTNHVISMPDHCLNRLSIYSVRKRPFDNWYTNSPPLHHLWWLMMIIIAIIIRAPQTGVCLLGQSKKGEVLWLLTFSATCLSKIIKISWRTSKLEQAKGVTFFGTPCMLYEWVTSHHIRIKFYNSCNTQTNNNVQ